MAEQPQPEVTEAIVVADVVGPPGPSEWRAMKEQAATIAGTEFVPSEMRGKPAVVLAAILTGREIGLGPMAALQGIRIQDGKPAYDAELMRALVRRRGHKLNVVEKTYERCTIRGKRADTGEEAEVTWTLKDALIAGLIDSIGEDGLPQARSKNGYPMPWEKYPKRMLFARATSELVGELFSDVLVGGSYTPEELGAPEEWDEPKPAPGSDEEAIQRRGIAWRKVREAIESGQCSQEIATDIARRLDADLQTTEGAEDVAAHVIRFVETGELPEEPDVTQDGAVAATAPAPTSEPPPTDDSLSTRIRAAAVAPWKPTEQELEHQSPPRLHGYRASLIMSACDLIAAEGWDEAKVREILGAGPRRSVPKALAEGRIADLETALKMLEAAAEPAL